MKRLHLVGTSKDGKRLVFAQKKGAKFGSLEAPISAKLLKLIEGYLEAREAKRNPSPPEPETAEPVLVRVLGEPDAPGSQPGEGSDAPEPSAPASLGIVGSEQIDIPVQPGARGRVNEAEEQPIPGIGGPPANHPSVLQEPAVDPSEAIARIERIRPRREKPEIPARSKLTPAEIQTLIRAGRGIRSVANLAGTPIDWIRYLAEPIQEERRGIVRQMLKCKQERARLGPSASTIGDAIFENLRARGIRSPEVVIEEGFTAFRPDGREWRVRLAFTHRGRKQTASWSFDVQTRNVTPLNSLATSVGWLRDPSWEAEEGARPARARRPSSRGRAKTLKSSGRKRAAARRKRPARKTTSVRTKRRKSRG